MTRAEEERVVGSLLKAAKAPSGAEITGQPTLDAFRSLAESRGVSLVTVLRAAVREELATVVAMPPLKPNRHRSGSVTDIEGGTDGTTCRVIR